MCPPKCEKGQVTESPRRGSPERSSCRDRPGDAQQPGPPHARPAPGGPSEQDLTPRAARQGDTGGLTCLQHGTNRKMRFSEHKISYSNFI